MATQDTRSTSPDPRNPLLQRRERHQQSSSEGLFRRSWHAMTEMLSPFSSSALSKLPDTSQRNRDRETRADRIPEPLDTNGGASSNRVVMHRDYNAVNPVPVPIRVPKKVATTIKVEGKVWFANERTWVAYVNIAVLLGTLALALFNASKDAVARNFAYVYAVISVGVLIYGWVVYQRRITMIRKRDPGSFDQILGPVSISALLFFAVLANFIIRVQELRRKQIPVPQEP